MKKFKIITFIGLLALAVTPLKAQNFLSQNLLNAQSIYISNSVTYITNLAANINVQGTNLAGVTWTNNFGQLETATNISPAYTNSPLIATNIGAYVNLLKDGNMIWNRDNSYLTLPATNMCVYVHTLPAASGSAAATNAFVLEFEALPDGVSEANSTTFTFTSSLNTAVTSTKGLGWMFPLNSAVVPGCKSIRLRKVYLATAAGAAAADFWIDDITLNGSQP